MTYTEAVESIKKYICCEKPIQRHCQDSCLYEIENCPYSLAIEAMEKQIPKKPIIKKSCKVNAFTLICPNCGAVLQSDSPHCRHCGQAIDWSEDDDR